MGKFIGYKTLAFQLRSHDLQDGDRFPTSAAYFCDFLAQLRNNLRFSH